MDLGTNANTISDFHSGHLAANSHGFADYFMPYANRQRHSSPSAGDRMHISATDATRIDFDVDISLLEWFWFELFCHLDVFSVAPQHQCHKLLAF